MLAYQVDYHKLQEQKRTNRANEAIGWENVDINRFNADTNRYNYFVNQQNADTNRLNYFVNKQNADTNRYNYYVNAQNAETNRMNADTNRYNYYVNAENAASNTRNALTNVQAQNLREKQFEYEKSIKPFELETNRISAEGSYLRGAASAYTAPSTVELNTARASREKTGRILDIVNTAGNQLTGVSKEAREWAEFVKKYGKNKNETLWQQYSFIKH